MIVGRAGQHRRSVGRAKMSTGSDTSWVGKKPIRRVGGMSDVLSIASELGFQVSHPHSLEELQNSADGTGEKCDDLVRVLRELTAVQRKIADLEVELRGRKDDKNVAHLTHVSEMEKKCETLARITTILKDVIQNKDRIIARLQQPYSLDCIPVEAEYQKQFSELLMKAASDYGALTASVADFQWSQNFKEPPSVWGEMLRPIPVALASCTRFFEAMSAMRESFAMLQKLRVGHSTTSLPSTPVSDPSQRISSADSECVTPPPWINDSSFDDLAVKMSRQQLDQRDGNEYIGMAETDQVDDTGYRRLSWPLSVKKNGL
ncbi:AUGMIN subunit 2 [Ancistrocladus abbreviatus]